MFDTEKFQKADIKLRTKKIEVPQLSAFFNGDPLWEVRGLTGEEVARVNEAEERNKSLEAVIKAMAGAGINEKSEALKEALGLGDEVPGDIARRIEILIFGSVAPACDRELAIRLSTFYPTVFYELTNEILILSGEGGDIVGKP